MDIEENTPSDGYNIFNINTFQFPNTIMLSFEDKYGTRYTKKFTPCQRCIMYEKIYKENELSSAERDIKEIIT